MIKIQIRESTKCETEQSGYVTFPYDPTIVNIMRIQPIRFWLADTKEWEVPYNMINRLVENLKGYQVIISLGEEQKITASEFINKKIKSKTPLPDTIPKDYKFKTKPFPHQIEGINYGLAHDKFLLADEQGLGKTMQIINIACIKKKLYGYKRCLIICGVNGLKWNWEKEIQIHSNETGYILGTRTTKAGVEKIGGNWDKVTDLRNLDKIDSYFLITNIESLRDVDVIKELKRLCDNNEIQMIAVDEAHTCKNPTSIQGKNLLKLQTPTQISMTGTPLMNNPIDLYIHLKWLGFESSNYYMFKKRYCILGGFGGYQVIGYKNLDALKLQADAIMLRRLKKNVLNLPEKIYIDEYVEMGAKQTKIYKEITQIVQENLDLIEKAVDPLAQLLRLRQATDHTGIISTTIQESAKLERLKEIIEDVVSNGGKAIVFSNWTSMINPTYEYLKAYNPAIITGEIKDRVAQQDKFMQDAKCKVIVGTIGAMGTGLTLTAANTVIFLDEPWNKAIKSQAEDRAHRIGTSSSVNIITLMCKNTIDERVHEILEQKGNIAELMLDKKLSLNDKKKLIKFLIT